MTILSDQAENALRRALEAEHGIQILVHESNNEVSTPSWRARQILYRFRREIGDKELERIQIHTCPSDPDHRLWLIKNQE